LDCYRLLLVTGYSSIKAIADINGLKSARTLTETVKAVDKRYLGYVGAAVMAASQIPSVRTAG